MAEYIDRSKIIAKKHGCDNHRKCSDCDFAIEGDSWCNGEIFVVDILRVPAADVQPVVHGKWIEKPYLLGTSKFCSLCGNNYGMPHETYNYCPNCGAKMDLEG